MTELNVITGSEWHTSYGAYGKINVYADGQMTPHFKVSGCDTNWDDVVEIGNHGKHGKWIPAILDLKPGTLIYVEGASTWRGKANEKARGWFEVDPDSPSVEITTPGYSNRSLEIYGNLRRLSYQEMKEFDLPVTIRSSKHLSVREMEVA